MLNEIFVVGFEGHSLTFDREGLQLFASSVWRIHHSGYLSNAYKSFHIALLGCKEGLEIDHKNRDKLDNRRDNLRFTNRSVNIQNRPCRKDKIRSMYKGVYPTKNGWEARINKDGKAYPLGRFSTEESAAIAYDIKAKELYGEDCFVNFNLVSCNK